MCAERVLVFRGYGDVLRGAGAVYWRACEEGLRGIARGVRVLIRGGREGRPAGNVAAARYAPLVAHMNN